MTGEIPQNSQKEALQEILHHLPLDSCEKKEDSITGMKGFFAPDGKIFRITGQFTVVFDTSTGCFFNCIPKFSKELFISENKEKYVRILEEVGNDEEKALRILADLDDMYYSKETPSTEFKGKWLESDTERPYLNVMEELEPYIEDQFISRIENLTPDSDQPVTFYSDGMQNTAFVEWTQSYAKAELGFCSVELVDYEEPKKKLFIMKKKKVVQEIRLPLPEDPDDRRKRNVDVFLPEKPKVLRIPKEIFRLPNKP